MVAEPNVVDTYDCRLTTREKVVELVIRDNEFRTYEELCNDFEVGK